MRIVAAARAISKIERIWPVPARTSLVLSGYSQAFYSYNYYSYLYARTFLKSILFIAALHSSNLVLIISNLEIQMASAEPKKRS